MRDRSGSPRFRRLGRLDVLHRVLVPVLACELAALFDLCLQFGTDVSLTAAASSRPLLRLGPGARRLIAPRLVLAVAAGALRLAAVGTTCFLLLAVAAARLLLSAAMPLLLLLRPALLLLFPAGLLVPSLAAYSGLESFDHPALDRCD